MGVPHGRKKHLWVLLSDPQKHGACGVIVNFSTDEERSGAECPLGVHEHPWFTEPTTWVCFGDATLLTPESWPHILKGIACRVIIPERKCSAELLAKVIQGAKTSSLQRYGGFRKDYLPFLD